jgi:hypothetical protein
MYDRQQEWSAARAPDPYATLQVSPAADADIIEAAYRVLARRYHPDLNRSADATERMAQINAAWDVLRDPERRAAYDREASGFAPRTAATGAPAAPRPASPEKGGAAPELVVDPERVGVSLRRGGRSVVHLSAYTVPPGIRVEAAVVRGQSWLSVSPEVLKGLVKEDLTVSFHARGLAVGNHEGAVRVVTSWESRDVPVFLQVRRANLLYRLLTLLRYGPSGEGSAVPLLLAVVVLFAIVAGLVFVALGR